jgi:Protein of unknown function (DUF2628)/zinc-ribbon domain
MRLCPSCGAEILPAATSCPQCGQRLAPWDVPEEISIERRPATAAAPSAPASVDADEAIRAYVGPRADYYLAQWTASANRPWGLSWNWAAFFGGLLWMVYRKMYAFALIYFVMAMALGVALERLHLSLAMKAACDLAVVAFVSLQGNEWYRLHARRRVDEIVLRVESADRRRTLVRSGGTNLVAALGIGLLWALWVATNLPLPSPMAGH